MNEPVEEIRDFLRTRLTDPNASGRDIANYVYTWWPRHDLTIDSFPLVTVSQLSETGEPMGLGSTTHWEIFQMQIDIWAKEDTLFAIPTAGTTREGKQIAVTIARQVKEAFRLYWISDLAQTGYFKIYKLSGNKPVSYDLEKKLWKVTLTLELEVDIGDGWIDY